MVTAGEGRRPAAGDPGGPGESGLPIRTRLTELVGIRYPIVQTGMGYVAGARLAAATSAAGGLASLPGRR